MRMATRVGACSTGPVPSWVCALVRRHGSARDAGRRPRRGIIAPCPRWKPHRNTDMPIESPQGPLTVAVVGATGLVGRTMMAILAERDFPVGELRPLASRSDGRSVDFGGRSWPVETATPAAFEGVDIALFSAGGGASKVFAPEAASRGAVVVDNSSQWRMEPGVPLVVAGVNDADAAQHEGIVANPNCSTMQLMPLFMALRDAVGLERVIVDTYQAVSGTGADAIAEFEGQIRAHVGG